MEGWEISRDWELPSHLGQVLIGPSGVYWIITIASPDVPGTHFQQEATTLMFKGYIPVTPEKSEEDISAIFYFGERKEKRQQLEMNLWLWLVSWIILTIIIYIHLQTNHATCKFLYIERLTTQCEYSNSSVQTMNSKATALLRCNSQALDYYIYNLIYCTTSTN